MSTIDSIRSRVTERSDDAGHPLGGLLRPPRLLMLPMVLLLLFMFVGPMVAIVVFSVQTGNAISLNPLDWTLAHYAEVIGGMLSGQGVYGQVLVNTVLVSITTTVITLLVSYTPQRTRWPARSTGTSSCS